MSWYERMSVLRAWNALSSGRLLSIYDQRIHLQPLEKHGLASPLEVAHGR